MHNQSQYNILQFHDMFYSFARWSNTKWSLHQQHTDGFYCLLEFHSWVNLCLISGSFLFAFLIFDHYMIWLTILANFSQSFGLFNFWRKLKALNNNMGNYAGSNDNNSFISTKFDGSLRRSYWESSPRSHFVLMSLSSVILVIIFWPCDFKNIHLWKHSWLFCQ